MPKTVLVKLSIERHVPFIDGDEDGDKTVDHTVGALEAGGWKVDVDDVGNPPASAEGGEESEDDDEDDDEEGEDDEDEDDDEEEDLPAPVAP
jgi:hypothetical protein